MKMLSVKRNIIVLIFAVILLIYGVQSISYGQEDGTPTVTAGETNTSLKVSFTDLFYAFDEKAYQVQLRRKTPQGDWITRCDVISVGCGGGSALGGLPIIGGFFGGGCGGPWHLTVNFKNFIFTDLEPGTTYEVRYRDTNLRECHDNPPAPDPWSEIAEGMTHLVPPPRVEFVDATLATAVRKALDLDTQGGHIELLQIPEAELPKLTALQYSSNDERNPPNFRSKIVNLTGLEHATQLATLSLPENNISDLSPLAQLTQLTTLDLSDNNISDLTPLAQLTQLTTLSLGGWDGNKISNILPLGQLTQLITLDLSDNNISDLTPLAQLTQLTMLSLPENNISDLTPLSQLTQLTELDLGGFHGNNISDLTPLTQLTLLTELDLANNNISDLTPLAQLTLLTELDLGFNNIIDITPLAQLINLKFLFLIGNNISDLTPLAQLSQRTTIFASYNPVNFKGMPSDIELMTVSTPQPLTSATLNGSSVTLTLLPSGAAYDTSIDNIRNALTLTGIDGVTVSDVIRVSDTELNVTFGFTGNLENTTTLTISLGAEAVSGYEGRALTGAIPVYPELGLTVSSSYPLSAATLNKSVVTLTLSSGAFGFRSSIRDALTISGITGITFHRTDIEEVSDTEVRIELTFKGNIETDTILTFTLGADAIEDYKGPALTAEISVSATAEVTEGLVASTPFPLTEANLHESVVTLTLGGKKYDTNWNFVSGNVTVSGIDGVTFRRHNVKRVNDVQVTIQLEFNGNISTDSTLTFTVGAKAIANYDGPALTAELPVTVSAISETPTTTDAVVSISPSSVASPAVGEQVEFTLNITGGEAVAGYQASLQFDTTALRYVSGANADFLPAGAFFVEPVVEGNLVKLNAASLAGESNGDGTLAKLTFEVIAAKASALTLSDVLLTDTEGIAYVPNVENAEITEPTGLKGDVNGDGIVNIQDLVLVASNLGKTGQNAADINGDGQVNIQDLVLVAGALGTSAAAPSLNSESLSTLTTADVKSWLSQARQLNLTDATSQRGILFLEQLLAKLTPKETVLLPNYPNPFNPETWIPYYLSKDTDVTLHIYAVNGTLVRTLLLGHQAAGIYQSRSRAVYWDGRNEFGEKVASGLYFYTLTAGDFSATRKMLIRK